MSRFTHLESPMTIRGKVYKNRLIAAPTLFAHSVFFLPDIAENVYRMVENRAKGGFAAMSTGAGRVCAKGRRAGVCAEPGNDGKNLQ